MEENNEGKERKAKRLTDEELEQIVIETQKDDVASRMAKSVVYERNIFVREYVKRRAKGICQLCDKEAPFTNKIGEPYLEIHHIQWLSMGGLDTIDNTVALCPNCHKKMHILDCKEDRDKLKRTIKRSI